MIEQDSKYNSNQSQKDDSKSNATICAKESEHSPVLPMIPKVPETNSIKRESPIHGSATDNM